MVRLTIVFDLVGIGGAAGIRFTPSAWECFPGAIRDDGDVGLRDAVKQMANKLLQTGGPSTCGTDADGADRRHRSPDRPRADRGGNRRLGVIPTDVVDRVRAHSPRFGLLDGLATEEGSRCPMLGRG
jgi:CubicO group peptidase (beta-lactamase class C family)